MYKFALIKKIILLCVAAVLALGIAFFVPAGTLDFWQAWAYMAAVLVPPLFVIAYFLKKDPAFLKRRMQMKEKEAKQKLIVKAGVPLFLAGFLMPGLDRRFGWSDVPLWLEIAAFAAVLVGYFIVFLSFKENSYAGRTVRVEKEQKVISTGPYSIVRHPMYFGTLLMFLATPIALGSYWALIPFLLYAPLLVLRILNEEEVLLRGLPGYGGYCKKTAYRLLPFIW